jgi:hypothetical protein
MIAQQPNPNIHEPMPIKSMVEIKLQDGLKMLQKIH